MGGAALLRRMNRYGLLTEDELELDFVLQLTTQKLLERRLQTKVFKQGLAKSIHHARVLIRQRHISVGGQLVNVPSFNVRTSSENTSISPPTRHTARAPRGAWRRNVPLR